MSEIDGQHGAYTYRYARRQLGDAALRTAIEARELVGFGRGVLLDARRVLDPRTRCAGALLLAGGDAVLVGPTAAALHGCTAVGGFPVHVRVPHDRRVRSRGGMVVHQGRVAPGDLTALDGLRVLTLPAAITEILCSAPRRAALAATDQALHPLRPEDRPAFLGDVAERLAMRLDRRGVRRASTLLGLATGLPESPGQSAILLVLADLGFPLPTCQFEVHGRPHLDFAWPASRIALEYRENDGTVDADPPPDWTVISADAQDIADPAALAGRLRTAFRSHECAA